MKFVVGLTTLESKHEAISMSRDLVEQGLVACAQVSGPIVSVYHWNDSLSESEEWQVQFKTVSRHVLRVKQWIQVNHPYDEPELIFMNVCEGSASYLNWVAQQCGDLC